MNDANSQTDLLARAQEIRQRGESTRRRDSATARTSYEQAVTLFRQVGEPLSLAHVIRHLGDVYFEQGNPDLAEPCFLEALQIYAGLKDTSSLDFANALRSLAVLRWAQSKTLWTQVRDLYTALNIEPGIKESTSRVAALSIR